MSVYGAVTFENLDQAEATLKTLEGLEKDGHLSLKDAIVITKDEEGKLQVKQTTDATPKRGAVVGGAIGLVIGVVVGGPVGGALLGGAAGAFAGKKVDLGIPDDRITAVSEAMHNASSAILLSIDESHTNIALLKAAIKQAGGVIHEVEVEGGVEVDLQQTLNSFNASGSN